MDNKLKEMLNRATKLQARIPRERRIMPNSGSQEKVYTFTESELRLHDAKVWLEGYQDGWGYIPLSSTNPYVDGKCKIVGPYLPVGDTDWMCRTHDIEAVLRPGVTPGNQLKKSDLMCPLGGPNG